jgi:hypothetical protein
MSFRGISMLAALAFGALLDLYVALRPDPPPIDKTVMAAAVEKMKAAAQPGDLLVHSPLFSMQELDALGTIPAKPDVPSPAITASRRVVVLDRTDHPMRGLGRPSAVIEVPESKGALSIEVFEPSGPREAVLYDHAQRITAQTMRVERPPGSVISRCNIARSDGGFACPQLEEWLHIAQVALLIDGHEASCVWAHPTAGGVIVHEIPALPDPPAKAHYVMTLKAGLSDDAVRMTADGTPVKTDIVQNGTTKGSVTVPNRIGWQEVTVDVEPGRPIELRITSPRDGRRHHCLNVEVKQVEGSRP